MHEITLLGLPECLAALDAMLAAAQTSAARPMALAVVNAYGELMLFARMDGASPATQDFAFKKAYTAARMGADLKDFRASLEQRGRSVSDYGDANLVGMAAGGVVITDGGGALGGIGVSGGTPDEDEQIARVGLKALRESQD